MKTQMQIFLLTEIWILCNADLNNKIVLNVPLTAGEEADCRFSASQVFLEQKVLAVCQTHKFQRNTGHDKVLLQ